MKLSNEELIDDENIKWVMILGDDDVLSKNVVEEFYKNYNEFDCRANVVRYASQKINDTNFKISDIYFHPVIETATEYINRKYNTKTRSSLSEYVFNLTVIKLIKFRDLPLAWYSDIIAVIETAKESYIYTINNAVVKVRYSTLNISGINDAVYSKKKLEAQRVYCNFLLDNISIFNKKNEIKRIILKYLKWDKKNIKLIVKYIIK
jgi:hypothetical protein